MSKRSTTKKCVTNQELLEPQNWGEFSAYPETFVSLMTPPLHVLKAAYLDPKPTDIAYIAVIGADKRRIRKQKRKTKKKSTIDRGGGLECDDILGMRREKEKVLETEPPKYQLLVDGEPLDLSPAPPSPRQLISYKSSASMHTTRTQQESVTSFYSCTENETDSKSPMLKSSSDETERTASDMSETEDADCQTEHSDSRSDLHEQLAEALSQDCDESAAPYWRTSISEKSSGLRYSFESVLSAIYSAGSTFRQALGLPERAADETPSPNEFDEQQKEAIVSKWELLRERNIAELLVKLEETEKRERKLEKQLRQSGVQIAEDIPYEVAKSKIEQICARLQEIGSSDVTHPDKDEQTRLREEYFKLEQDMEKYSAALTLSDEYQAEQEALEQAWENQNRDQNLAALKQLRRHMPVNIQRLTSEELMAGVPPGRGLPADIVKKFKRTNVLQILRIDPVEIERMHPSTLEGKRVTGLTLTERRAIYVHINQCAEKWKAMKDDKMTERKWTWFCMMKQNFKESLSAYQRHVEQYGPPQNHRKKSNEHPDGCPLLGKQCPIAADRLIDYSGDYGYPEGDEYEESDIKRAAPVESEANAEQLRKEIEREKRSLERLAGLKSHYKSKLLQVSKASGSCEAMDESMEKIENRLTRWIESALKKGDCDGDDKKMLISEFTDALNDLKLAILGFAQRSGMQVSGAKKAGQDSDDSRSLIEAILAEKVVATVAELFSYIGKRMKELDVADNRVTSTIQTLQTMVDELHHRNLALIEVLEPNRVSGEEAHVLWKDLEARVRENIRLQSSESTESQAPPAPPTPAKNLMAEIASRNRGKGGLLASIVARGHVTEDDRVIVQDDRQASQRSLMQQISSRTKSNGRGDLLASIRSRASANDDEKPNRRSMMEELMAKRKPSNTSDLMAEIAARGNSVRLGSASNLEVDAVTSDKGNGETLGSQTENIPGKRVPQLGSDAHDQNFSSTRQLLIEELEKRNTSNRKLDTRTGASPTAESECARVARVSTLEVDDSAASVLTAGCSPNARTKESEPDGSGLRIDLCGPTTQDGRNESEEIRQ